MNSVTNHKYLVISIGKSGSNWLNNIISGLPGITKFDMASNGFTAGAWDEIEMLAENTVVYTHVQYSAEHIHKLKDLNIRPFYIYRDLRDVLVSEFYHKAYLDRARFVEKNRILAILDNHNAFDIENIMRWSTAAPHYFDVRNWVAFSGIPCVRFEDLVDDPFGHLNRIFALSGLNYPDDAIVEAIQNASFKRITGREAGQEDRYNHYRKGIVGDWKNHFSDEQAAALETIFGDLLSELGYSIGQRTCSNSFASWWKSRPPLWT